MVVFQAHIDIMIALFVMTNIIETNADTKTCRNLAPPPHSKSFKHISEFQKTHKYASRYKGLRKLINDILVIGANVHNEKNKKVVVILLKQLTQFCTEVIHKVLWLNVVLTNHIKTTFIKTLLPIMHLTNPTKLSECMKWIEQLTKERLTKEPSGNIFHIKPHALKCLNRVMEHMTTTRRKCQINIVKQEQESQSMQFGDIMVKIKNGEPCMVE